MTTPDVNVVLLNFPNPGKEMVVPNEDGSYTILLNARLSFEEQAKSYEHALEHIKNLDFEKVDVQEIEVQAHKLPSKADKINIDMQNMENNIKRRKKRLSAQRRKQAARMEFIEKHILPHNPDYFFEQAEQKWLYGET